MREEKEKRMGGKGSERGEGKENGRKGWATDHLAYRIKCVIKTSTLR